MNLVRALFPKIRALFFKFEKGQGRAGQRRPPPPPPPPPPAPPPPSRPPPLVTRLFWHEETGGPDWFVFSEVLGLEVCFY